MQKAPKKNLSALKLSAILLVAILATGCISAGSKPTEVATPATPETTPVEAPAATEDVVDAVVWTVVKGDNLWDIAAHDEVYNVPQKWPLIYKENLDQIFDPDLIYPGQVFDIPTAASQIEIDAAIEHAKKRGAWEVGQIEASDKAYLLNSK